MSLIYFLVHFTIKSDSVHLLKQQLDNSLTVMTELNGVVLQPAWLPLYLIKKFYKGFPFFFKKSLSWILKHSIICIYLKQASYTLSLGIGLHLGENLLCVLEGHCQCLSRTTLSQPKLHSCSFTNSLTPSNWQTKALQTGRPETSAGK